MYCGVNNLTPPPLWLHMFCYFLNNITVKITILSIQSWSSVTEKRKWLDALCPPFPLLYQLDIFLPLSTVVTCQYHAGFPTSTLSYLPSFCVVLYWCSKHSQRDVLSEQFFSDLMKNVTYSERVDMILWYGAASLCGRWAQRMYAKRLPGTHAAPHNLHVHCPATVENCDPGCNEDHMQPGVWGWGSSCHRWSIGLAIPCKWIAGLFGTCYMNRSSMSSTENMQWGRQIFQLSAVFSVVPTSVYYTNLPHFVSFTHDACFMCEAIFNSWNNHICDEDNPHATLLKWYQQQFAVSVWAGTVNDHLTGLYMLSPTLNDYKHHRFSQALPEVLEDIWL